MKNVGVVGGTFVVLTVAAALLAGCAGAASERLAGSSAQSATDAKWQAMANQATRALKVGPVYVEQDARFYGGRYFCREQRIELTTRGNVRWTLAHELGHHVRRDCAESAANEMEANALAVQVLQVWGVSEADATRETARQLLAMTKSSRNTLMVGHDLCAELRDFLSRYPTAADPRKAGECGAG